MGIKGLLSELPGGDVADAVRFAEVLELQSRPVDIDTGTLLFQCAYKHQAIYKQGNYVPAVREFLEYRAKFSHTPIPSSRASE